MSECFILWGFFSIIFYYRWQNSTWCADLSSPLEYTVFFTKALTHQVARMFCNFSLVSTTMGEKKSFVNIGPGIVVYLSSIDEESSDVYLNCGFKTLGGWQISRLSSMYKENVTFSCNFFLHWRDQHVRSMNFICSWLDTAWIGLICYPVSWQRINSPFKENRVNNISISSKLCKWYSTSWI